MAPELLDVLPAFACHRNNNLWPLRRSGFCEAVAREIARLTGLLFVTAAPRLRGKRGPTLVEGALLFVY